MSEEQPTPAEDDVDAVLALQGAQLEPEEMAALTAVLAQLRAQRAAAPARRAAPLRPDRTLRRRRDLGLWERPGAGSWRNGAGPA